MAGVKHALTENLFKTNLNWGLILIDSKESDVQLFYFIKPYSNSRTNPNLNGILKCNI